MTHQKTLDPKSRTVQVRNDILDWHGDHPHTNYHNLYDGLRDAGLWLEVLGSPLTCFDASQVCSQSLGSRVCSAHWYPALWSALGNAGCGDAR